MSQHENAEKHQNQQQPQNVRVVPIFVEGRDEPVINKDFPDAPTTASAGVGVGGGMPHHTHHQMHRDMPQHDRMSADFGADFGAPPKGSSIFDRVKNFPVTSTFRDFFRDSESPARTIPVNHMNEPKVHSYRQASPQPQQQQQQPAAPEHERTRTFSNSSTGSQGFHQQQNHHHQPQQQSEQQQQPKVPQKMEENIPQQAAAAPKKPAPLDPITKIQQIQKDVLDLMNKVEQFEGKTRKDKEFLYLEEMLTQNLLKLDTVDTNGKENVKLARKEAVKCINRCLSVLEAKAEQAEENLRQNPEQQTIAEQPSKTSSSGSVYDNSTEASAAVPTQEQQNNQENTEITTNIDQQTSQ